MGLKQKLEDNIIFVLAAVTVAVAATTWAVAEAVRVAPQNDHISLLESNLKEARNRIHALSKELQQLPPGHDCSKEIEKAIDEIKQNASIHFSQADMQAVQLAVQGLDSGRKERILSHIPNRDWSGVAEDLLSPFNDNKENTAKLILRYFPTALQALGSSVLFKPEVKISWP